MNEKNILLAHGGGGLMMNTLIKELFLHYFDNKILTDQADAAILPLPGKKIAFTTDSFVVDPIFFPGGDIGKLSVCGTLNDLAVSGAIPLYLSLSLILEEGFPIAELEKIVQSIADSAIDGGVQIVAGDTKVVPKGKGDKLFITTTGIGILTDEFPCLNHRNAIQAGDQIICNGSVGDHGIAILLQRESFQFQTNIESDCANLTPLIRQALHVCPDIRFIRDATRGGVATVLCELVEGCSFGIGLDESEIPVKPAVANICDILGMDPLYLANEGKAIFVVPEDYAGDILEKMHKHPLGREAAIIGKIVADHPGRIVLHTHSGGNRLVDYITGDQLPRIC